MRQLPLYILFLVFANCNNKGASTENKTDSNKQSSNASTVTDNIPAGTCGSLIYFQKGAIVQGSSYDSTGKEVSKQTTTIMDVKNDGDNLMSDMKMETSTALGNHEIDAEYKCDGKYLYIDLGTISSIVRIKGAKVESSSLEFPVQLSVGQTLPEASLTISIERGAMKMKTTASHVNRKVEKIEKITTPAGTWNCYKVTSTIQTTTEMGGNVKQAAQLQKMIAWFAPDFGVVKTDMYVNGKLATSSYITSVKK